MNPKYSPIRRTMRLVLQLLLLVGFVLLSVWAVAQTTATVSTDQSDYPPGSTVYITGSGYLAGESVSLQVLHTDESLDNATSITGAHLPWLVTADSSGNISTTWIVPFDEDELGASLKLTADGQSSGLHAEALFTDSINKNPIDATVCEGGSASFSVSLSGQGQSSASYQWQVSSTNGSTYNNITNGSIYSGATSPTLSLSGITLSMNGYLYRCVVQQTGGPFTSTGARLTVNPSVTPSITIALTSGTNPTCAGTSLTFTASASNGGTAPAYLWQVNGINTGTNSISYTSSSLADNDLITCMLTSNAGCVTSTTVTSNSIPLGIDEPTGAISGTQSICFGGSVTLSIAVTGSGPWSGNLSNGLSFSGNSSPILATVNPVSSTTYTISTLSDSECTSLAADKTGSAVVTVRPTPSAAILVNGTNPICSGSSSTVKITGPANGVVTYNIDGGSALTANLNNGGNIIISTAALSTATTYNLISVSYGDSPECSAAISGSATVLVNTAPVISCPEPLTVFNQANSCGANVSFSAVAVGSPEPTLSYSIAPGSFFAVGTTPVTVSASNVCGITTCSFNITITDNEQPSITAAADVLVENAPGSAEVTLTAPTTSDNCGVATVTNDHPSSTYPIGVTTVTWTVADVNGNTNTAKQNVTVVNSEPPSITAAPDVFVNSDPGLCTAEVILTIPTTSDYSGIASVTNDHPSSTYPVGQTTVTWTVTNVYGITNTAKQNVTVTDGELPSITLAADVLVNNLPGLCSAEITLAEPTTTDNCGVASLTNDHPSTTYLVGETIVTWTVTDVHGNTNTATQKITVKDNEWPTISAPQPLILNTNSGCFATSVSLGSPITSDNCGVQDVTNNAPSSFSLGTTTVLWTVTDLHGHSTTTSQTVTVNDVEVPVFASISGNIVLAACSPIATWETPIATDNCSVEVIQTAGPTSGSSFANGSATTITYMATDGSGNSVSASFTVTRLPELSAVATGTNVSCYGGNNGSSSVSVSGGKSPYTYVWNNGSISNSISNLVIGLYSVTVTDADGCSVSSSYTVTQPTILAASSSATAILCYGGSSTVTVSASGGTVPYLGTGTFSRTAGSWSFTVTDANGCTSATSATITQPSPLTASITTNNSYLYFGYSGDQSATITASPSGGTPPYTVSITMVNGEGSKIRTGGKLICDYITNSGDETWTAGANTQSTISGCAIEPVSTSKNNIASGGTYAVNVTLLDDARFIATVTDANGCTYTIPYASAARVDAEDVRCFAGNTNVQKVTVCHRTGNAKNPCVTICIDESAVNDHLAHGDFFGPCNNSCTASVANARITNDNSGSNTESFEIDTYPNPFRGSLSVKVSNPENAEVSVNMVDVTGRVIEVNIQSKTDDSVYTLETDKIVSGFYILRINIGNASKAIKVMKE